MIVDLLGFDVMKNLTGGIPLIFDVTHSLQRREVGSAASGGRRRQIMGLAKAGIAAGVAGLFVETNPTPNEAKCDGPSAWPLNKLEALLVQIKKQDELAKSLPSIEVE